MGNTSTLKIEILVAAYESGISAYQMAKDYGCSFWSVRARLMAAGVQMRPGGVPKVLNLNPEQKPLFNSLNAGLLLGDASVNGNGNKASKCFLRMEQSNVRFGWLEQIVDAYVELGVHVNIIPVKKKRTPPTIDGRSILKGPSSLLYTGVSEEFRTLRAEWYPRDGMKRVPSNLRLDPLTVAMWFCGDGSRFHSGIIFHTQGFLKKDVQFLVRRLRDDLGIHSVISKTPRKNQFRVSVFQMAEAVRLRDLILPHMPECCLYKLDKVRDPKRSKGTSKLSDDEVRTIRTSTLSHVDMAADYMVSRATIRKVATGLSYRHVGSVPAVVVA